jgi:hypothetical protein
MPIPASINDLSQTAGSNYPAGSESPTTTDDYLRSHASFLALLRDGKGLSVEVDVASAATCDIGAANSPLVRITGTTTITSFGTNYTAPRFVRFADALTLTHNATSLVIPDGANITTAAGDTCIVTPKSNGWIVSQYSRTSSLASSAEVIAGTNAVKVMTPSAFRAGAVVAGTPVATTSGTSVDFTGYPSWTQEIILPVVGLSTSGSSTPILLLGGSGGFELTGYSGAVFSCNATPTINIANHSTSFLLSQGHLASVVYHGEIRLVRESAASNTWTISFFLSASSSQFVVYGSGSKSLSGTLTQVRLTTAGGTDTFDAGSINSLHK